MLLDLWPSIRRIQFASLRLRLTDLPRNIRYFKKMVDCLNENNPGRAEQIVREYAENEKKYALDIIKQGIVCYVLQRRCECIV